MMLVFGKSGQVASELARILPDAVYLGGDQADPDACSARSRISHQRLPAPECRSLASRMACSGLNEAGLTRPDWRPELGNIIKELGDNA